MAVFLVQNQNHPVAQAITAYARYFGLPGSVDLEANVARKTEIQTDVSVWYFEATKFDFNTMRRLEQLMADHVRLVFLVAPPPLPELESTVNDMPYLFRCDINPSASVFSSLLRNMLNYVEKRKHFFLEFTTAEAALEAGHYQDVIATVRRLQTQAVDPYACHMLLARVLFKVGKLEDALKQAQLASRVKPRSLASRSLVGAIYHKLGQVDKAEKILEMSLDVAEASIGYLVQLGDVYFDQGKVGKSKAAYQKAAFLDPKNQKAQEGMMAVSLLEGDFKPSKSGTSAGYAHFDLARFCNLRAIGLVNNRRYSEADTMYKNTINILDNGPDVYKVLFNQALCTKKSGDLRKSLEQFLKCKTLAPKAFDRVDEQIQSLQSKLAG